MRAGLLSFALHRLARDPSLLAAVRAEVDAAVSDGMPTMKEVMGLDLVRRVLSEALRLWPTVPVITRVAKEDTTLAGRYAVPRGQRFGLVVHALHRDPAIWEDPARFDPERFLPDAVKARPSWAYEPFGIGRRSCIGRHFALVEATLALAVLARDFDFEDPGPSRLAPTASPKPRDFRLVVRPRRR